MVWCVQGYMSKLTPSLLVVMWLWESDFLVFVFLLSFFMAISDYEQLRLNKIAANEAKLKSLDLDSSYMQRQLAIEKNQNQNQNKTKKRPLPSTFVVQRKSSRTTTAPKVNYTTTKIITSSFPSTSNFKSKSLFNLPNLPDDHDFVAELKATKTREEKSSDALQSISEFISSMKTRIRLASEAMIPARYTTARFAFARWLHPQLTNHIIRLRSARRSSSSDLPPLEKDAVEQLRISGDFSHAEAITRWGLGVEASSPAAAPRSKEFWDKFVSSRSSTNDAPLSPTAFLQEHFQHDGYQLLVACLLMSRVSSHETKERCIKAFFDLCPTPTEFFYVDSAKLAEAIRSLGMQESRGKRVKNYWTVPEQSLRTKRCAWAN